MNKMNKKGFTLIEMLVVIAIIAVLVAIIIPTVSSATVKAAAAADAANLRALVAEASTDYLGGVANTDGMVKYTPAADGTAGTFKVTSAPSFKSKFLGATPTVTITLNSTTGVIDANVDGYTIAQFAETAEKGTVPTGPAVKPTVQVVGFDDAPILG